MDRNEIITMKSQFDAIAHYDDEAQIEFWYARELQEALGYTKWSNFIRVIDKAKDACETTTHAVSNHFADVGKMISIGKGATREVEDIKLTRYACYLIAQNGDPRKDEIAFAQSYFALQTRKQELIEDRINLLRRFEARERLSKSLKSSAVSLCDAVNACFNFCVSALD